MMGSLETLPRGLRSVFYGSRRLTWRASRDASPFAARQGPSLRRRGSRKRLFICSHTGKERGEAIVEFALLAPILFLLLFALVDFGRVFDAWVVSTNAAREGARYAAIYAGEDYLTTAQVQQLTRQKVQDYLNGGLGSRGDVSYGPADITVIVPLREPGQPVTVNVAVRVEIWALLNVFGSNTAGVNGNATMRI